MIRPLLKIKLIICSALLINNPIKTIKAVQYQNCYECTFTCFTKQYYDCLNQEDPNYLCQQNIACCTGDNLDKYIESKSCDRSCQTSWIYKKSKDGDSSFQSIRRSCMDTEHLHQDGARLVVRTDHQAAAARRRRGWAAAAIGGDRSKAALILASE